MRESISGYRYSHRAASASHQYLLPAVLNQLDNFVLRSPDKRLFEVGCGNGNIAWELSRYGWDVTGVDPSTEGIDQANSTHPGIKLFHGSAYEDLCGQYGRFPVVLSLEVVEHVYAPRD